MFVAAVQALQREVDEPAVLIVHHTGKGDSDTERGSSALRAAVDTMLLLRKQGEHLTLTCNKQKDSNQGNRIHLRLDKVEVTQGEGGDAVTSCVVRSDGDGAARQAASQPLPQQAPRQTAGRDDEEARRVLSRHPEGLRAGEWRKLVAETLNQAMSERTFARVRARLVDGGVVEEVPGAKFRYRVIATDR